MPPRPAIRAASGATPPKLLPLMPSTRRARLRPRRAPPQVPKPRRVAPCPALRRSLCRGGHGVPVLTPTLVGGRSAPTPDTNRPRVSSHTSPRSYPTGTATRAARIPASRPLPMARDPIIFPSFFPGILLQTRGLSVKAQKLPGACSEV
jgi:hypothetical protein